MVMVSRIIKVIVVATVRKKDGPPYDKGNGMHQNSKRHLVPKSPESFHEMVGM